MFYQKERFHICPTINNKYNSVHLRLLVIISILFLGTNKTQIFVIFCNLELDSRSFHLNPSPFCLLLWKNVIHNPNCSPVYVRFVHIRGCWRLLIIQGWWVLTPVDRGFVCMRAWPLCGPPGLSLSPDHIALTCGSIDYFNNQFLISRTATWRWPTTKVQFESLMLYFGAIQVQILPAKTPFFYLK